MSKIIRFHRTGEADVLQFEEMPPTEPKADEVRLRVEAIGLNRAEVLFRQGKYLEQPELPAKLGYEASGVIEAAGSAVSAFKVGDRVSTIPSFSQNQYGVYGESVIVPAYCLARYPSSLTANEAASIWMQYLTAWGGIIHHGALEAGQYVLITAASSSVGLAAIELVRLAGAHSIAATRTSAKKQALRDFGADTVVATGEENLAEAVGKVTGGAGADVVFDPVAGSFIERLAEATAPGGQIIEYGALSMEATPFPLATAIQKGLTVRGYTLFEVVSNPALRKKAEGYIYDQLEQGKLKPKIDRVFPFAEMVEAHRYMESNQQFGKVVVSVP